MYLYTHIYIYLREYKEGVREREGEDTNEEGQ